ncbi:MAG: hypothetical protein ACP5OR_07580 [Candidatus Dormibacteria bacterium]
MQLSSTLSSTGSGLADAYSLITSVGSEESGWTGSASRLFQAFMRGYADNLSKSATAFNDAGAYISRSVGTFQGMCDEIQNILNYDNPTMAEGLQLCRSLSDYQPPAAIPALTLGVQPPLTPAEEQHQQEFQRYSEICGQLNGDAARINDFVEQIAQEGHQLAAQLNDAALLSPHYKQYHAPGFWDDVAGAFTSAWHGVVAVDHFTEHIEEDAAHGMVQFADGFASAFVGIAKLAETLSVGTLGGLYQGIGELFGANLGVPGWVENAEARASALGNFAETLVGMHGFGASLHALETLGTSFIDLKDIESGNIGRWLGNMTGTVCLAFITMNAGALVSAVRGGAEAGMVAADGAAVVADDATSAAADTATELEVTPAEEVPSLSSRLSAKFSEVAGKTVEWGGQTGKSFLKEVASKAREEILKPVDGLDQYFKESAAGLKEIEKMQPSEVWSEVKQTVPKLVLKDLGSPNHLIKKSMETGMESSQGNAIHG